MKKTIFISLIFVLFLSSFACAINYVTQSTGIYLEVQNVQQQQCYGLQFVAKYNMYLINVSAKVSAHSIKYAYLYHGWTLESTASCHDIGSTTVCHFTENNTILTGETYNVGSDGGDEGVNIYYSNTDPAYPIIDSHINIVARMIYNDHLQTKPCYAFGNSHTTSTEVNTWDNFTFRNYTIPSNTLSFYDAAINSSNVVAGDDLNMSINISTAEGKTYFFETNFSGSWQNESFFNQSNYTVSYQVENSTVQTWYGNIPYPLNSWEFDGDTSTYAECPSSYHANSRCGIIENYTTITNAPAVMLFATGQGDFVYPNINCSYMVNFFNHSRNDWQNIMYDITGDVDTLNFTILRQDLIPYGSNYSLLIDVSSGKSTGYCGGGMYETNISMLSGVGIPYVANRTVSFVKKVTSLGNNCFKVWASQVDGEPAESTPDCFNVLNQIQVNLTSPANASMNNSNNVSFCFNATNLRADISSCSLFNNYTGSFIANISNSSSITSGQEYCIQENNIPDGTITWNVQCFTTQGYNAFAALNQIYIVDTTKPTISSNLDGNLNHFVFIASYAFNISDARLKNFTLTDSCSNSITNISMTNSWNFSIDYNITSCGVGQKIVNATACDLAGNCNSQSYAYSALGRIKISAYSIVYNTTISDFSVLLNGLLNGSTTNGTYIFDNLQNGTFNISIIPDSYEHKSFLFSLGSTAYNSTVFYLYGLNSLSLNFIDESTGLGINNVAFELISTAYSANLTTTNGSYYIELLQPTTYALRYISPGYSQRFFYFFFANGSHTSLTLPLLANDSEFIVLATVYDEGNHLVEDAYIKVLKYDAITNSYPLKEIARTNFEGTATIHLVPNTEFYEFIIDYPLGTAKKATSPSYIYSSTLTFQIYIGTQAGSKFLSANKIQYLLYYNNASQNVGYVYTDSDARISAGCLDVFTESGSSRTLYNETCISSTSGSILIPLDNSTGNSYIAYSSVIYSDAPTEKYAIDSLNKDFSAKPSIGPLGLFLVVLLTLVAVFIFRWDRTLAIIAAPLPLLIGSVIGWVDFSSGICISIEIVAIIIAYTLSKRY